MIKLPSLMRLAELVFVLICSGAIGEGEPAQETNTEAVRQLHALFEEDWEKRLAEDPVSASYMGDRRWNDQWPDVSPEALESENDRRILRGLRYHPVVMVPPQSNESPNRRHHT